MQAVVQAARAIPIFFNFQLAHDVDVRVLFQRLHFGDQVLE